jgi:CRISPR-associated protein Cas2
MSRRKPVIIAYDISEKKAWRQVYQIVKAWRLDGQKSVHECRLTEDEAQELLIQLSEPLNLETDTLMIAWLEPRRNVLCRGLGKNNINRKIWHLN